MQQLYFLSLPWTEAGREKGSFLKQPNTHAHLFERCRFSHVIQNDTSIRGTTCKKFSLWRHTTHLKSICGVGGLDKSDNKCEHGILLCVLWVSHLHRVEADRAEAVYAPGEGTDWATPLLVPDVHLLATCCKHIVLLMMVQSCEHSLRERRIVIIIWHFTERWCKYNCPWLYIVTYNPVINTVKDPNLNGFFLASCPCPPLHFMEIGSVVFE